MPFGFALRRVQFWILDEERQKDDEEKAEQIIHHQGMALGLVEVG